MATKVLILGSGGFIGRHLLEVLSQGQYSHIEILKQKVILEDYKSTINQVLAQEPDLVLQMAWTASSTPNYRHESTNLFWSGFTVQLADACQEVDSLFMGIGSGVELDSDPKDSYSLSKRETFLSLENAILNDRITWVRPGYVFDQVTESPSVVKEICTSKREGRQAQITNFYAKHDFVHVKDVANALALIINSKEKGLFEIGSGKLHSVRDIAESLDYVTNLSKDDFIYQTDLALDIRRLAELGWIPQFTNEFFNE